MNFSTGSVELGGGTAGVKLNDPSAAKFNVPFVGLLTNTDVRLCPSGSESFCRTPGAANGQRVSSAHGIEVVLGRGRTVGLRRADVDRESLRRDAAAAVARDRCHILCARLGDRRRPGNNPRIRIDRHALRRPVKGVGNRVAGVGIGGVHIVAIEPAHSRRGRRVRRDDWRQRSRRADLYGEALGGELPALILHAHSDVYYH